jgi:hypothetical protein
MKQTSRITFIAFVLLFSYLLAACGQALPAATTENQGSSAAQAVEFAGKVEAIKDNQWTINGQVVQVSAELAKESKFQVGDEVKVSAIVNADGTVLAERLSAFGVASASETLEPTETVEPTVTVEPTTTIEPTATVEPTATIEPTPTNDNSNGNGNDNSNDDNGNNNGNGNDNSNDDNSNDDNGNDDNGNDHNSNDDDSNDNNDNNNNG